MPAPVYFPAPQTAVYPAPAFVPAVGQRTQAAPAARAAVPAQPRPLVRAKGPDDPVPARRAPLAMPSPEQLGVAVRPTSIEPDWTAIHARIKELGLVSFHMDSAPDGRCRFTCWVPHAQPGLTRRIEALASTEVEAIRLGLERAGQTRTSRP